MTNHEDRRLEIARVRVEDLFPGGRRYVLPRRDFEKSVRLVITLCAPSLFFAWLALLPLAKHGISHPLVILIVVSTSMLVTSLALFLILGHVEIEVRDGLLRATTRLGPLRWSRTRPQTGITSLVVETGKQHKREAMESPMKDLSAIYIAWDGTGAWRIASGYSREMLLPLAQDLATRCGLAISDQGLAPESNPPIGAAAQAESKTLPPAVTLSPEIRVKDLPGGRRYRLPRRQFKTAMLFMLSNLGALWFVFVLGVIVTIIQRHPLIAAMIGCLGVLLLPTTLFLLFQHTEIVVRKGRLRATERFGLLRWSQARRQDSIARLVVENAWPHAETRRETLFPPGETQRAPTPPNKDSVICMEGHGLEPMRIAKGYPREMLLPLAHDLLAQCQPAVEAPFSMDVIDVETTELAEMHRKQPGDSTIVVTEEDGTLTLKIPSPGLLRGGQGVFWSALGFCVFLIFVSRIRIQEPGLIGMFGFVTILLALGMWTGIKMAFCKAIVVVVDGRLTIRQEAPFWSKEQSWTKEEISTIRAGSVTLLNGDIPVDELQVVSIKGKKFGLLRGRDAAELKWLASKFLRALGIPETRS